MDSKINKADAKVQKIRERKRRKGSEDRKVGSEVFDKITLETLYKLAKQDYIDILNGAISTGKEANVLKGITKDENYVAVKIYRIATSDFKKMFFSTVAVYIAVFVFVVIFGVSLFGFRFINCIPLLIGFAVALKISYFYTSYSANGITYCALLVIPQSCAFAETIIYTIKSSSLMSRQIYNSTTKKSDTEDFNLKLYLKDFVIYIVVIIVISALNSLITSSLVTIIKI